RSSQKLAPGKLSSAIARPVGAVTKANESMRSNLHSAARHIYARALESCSIARACDRRIRFEGGFALLYPEESGKTVRIPLDSFEKTYIIALGKAALSMTGAIFDRLPGVAGLRGLCCAPQLPEHPHPAIAYYVGGHPSPNQHSFEAARASIDLLKMADENTF